MLRSLRQYLRGRLRFNRGIEISTKLPLASTDHHVPLMAYCRVKPSIVMFSAIESCGIYLRSKPDDLLAAWLFDRTRLHLCDDPDPFAKAARTFKQGSRVSGSPIAPGEDDVFDMVVNIADRLAAHGVDYAYEQPLTIGDATKYPDFTIEDMESGENYYWEHCGMLHVPQYRRRWEDKLAWYRANRIFPSNEGGGERGVLILTQDGANGSIDAANIDRLITKILSR